MSLYTSLSIARQGLYVSQLGLQVTAANIANVNTEGYKRQRVLQANLPFGLGVTVQSVERQLHFFAERRLLGVTSDSIRANRIAVTYKNLEGLFNDVSQRGLDSEFEDFFACLQDLTVRPSGASERATLRSRAESIAHLFGFYYEQMESEMRSQDQEIEIAVSSANAIIRSIAELNGQIARSLDNKLGVNELRNDRDEWVRKLAEMMPVSITEDALGNYTVYIEKSMPLVVGTQYYQLETETDVTNNLKKDVVWTTDTGTRISVMNQLTNGSLGAALDIRDRIVPEQLEKLDRLAAEFVLAFNAQHRAGTGLDGVSGRNFFETLPVYAAAGKGSTGGAGILNAVVSDETQLTLHNYEVRFTSPTAWEVVNMTTGAAVSSGVYTPGMTLVFDGIQITVDDISGPPQAGDFFRVNTVTRAAANLRVSADVMYSLDAIAAGFSSAAGDNQNALLLAGLETAKFAAGGSMSFREVYQTMLVDLGIGAANANLRAGSQDTLLSQAKNLVESVSGVNIDEETTSLMAYQRAYQAAAKVISITDEMMASLLQMI